MKRFLTPRNAFNVDFNLALRLVYRSKVNRWNVSSLRLRVSYPSVARVVLEIFRHRFVGLQRATQVQGVTRKIQWRRSVHSPRWNVSSLRLQLSCRLWFRGCSRNLQTSNFRPPTRDACSGTWRCLCRCRLPRRCIDPWPGFAPLPICIHTCHANAVACRRPARAPACLYVSTRAPLADSRDRA